MAVSGVRYVIHTHKTVALDDAIYADPFRKDVARYGGEVFVALLPGTTLENTILAAERLRQKLETTLFITTAGPVTITVSLGVATFNFSADKNAESLLKRAAQAMQRAKALGRNRVCRE